MYSKKRSGMVHQGFAISVEENKLIRKAAELDKRSIRSWIGYNILLAAKRIIKKHERMNEGV